MSALEPPPPLSAAVALWMVARPLEAREPGESAYGWMVRVARQELGMSLAEATVWVDKQFGATE